MSYHITINQSQLFNPLLKTSLWIQGPQWYKSNKEKHETILCPSGMCTNFKYHHDIKQNHKFILPFVIPKPFYYSWKLIPSLYPNQRLKHVKNWCTHWYIFYYTLSDLCLKLSFVSWTWLTIFSQCAHTFSAIILADYSASTPSVNLTVNRLVFRMSVSFIIIM